MEAKETNITPQAELPILEVEHLRVQFTSDSGTTTAVVDESFSIRPGETLALVGESGSGKSVTSLSVMRLVEHGGGKIVNGSIKLRCRDGRVVDLRHANKSELQHLRGSEVAMIFQEPMTSLNPVFTVGAQIAESLILHRGMDEKEALKEAVHLLELVRIPDAERISLRFPHQLSGGMRQRGMIAMALACKPQLLIADEPTTALDVTVQAQILALISELQKEIGMAVLFITHDMGVVAQIADRVAVMRYGEIVESGTAQAIFAHPQHPYTQALLSAVPRLGALKDIEHPCFFRLIDPDNGKVIEPPSDKLPPLRKSSSLRPISSTCFRSGEITVEPNLRRYSPGAEPMRSRKAWLKFEMLWNPHRVLISEIGASVSTIICAARTMRNPLI